MSLVNKKENLSLVTEHATLLAITRTRLSAERTLMSWIRTSFSMITFGFGLIKFFQYFKTAEGIAPNPSMSGSIKLGLFLILLGIFALIPGIFEHQKQLSELHKLDGGRKWNYAFVVAILVGIIGLYALFSTITSKFF